MLKKFFAIAVLGFCFSVFTTTLFAQQETQVRKFEKGALGYFYFPFSPDQKDEFVVWPNKSLIGVGKLNGRITKKTVVKIFTIENRKIGRENLDLLTGKEVFAYGKFHQVGEGEGSYYQTDSLIIFVLAEDRR